MIFVRGACGRSSRHEPAAAVVAVVDREVDREDLHLERVARLRAFDVHRAGQDVPARTATVAGRYAAVIA